MLTKDNDFQNVHLINFVQNSVIFDMLYPVGYTAEDYSSYNLQLRCQWLV